MGRIRAPMDMHTAFVVSLASFASVYYTMYPWIQEAKAARAKKQYDAFQQLKREDPERAQRYIDSLRANERWYERKMREYRERQTVREQANQVYFDVRAQHGLKTVQFPDELYAPVPPEKRIRVPTLDQLDQSELLGRSLSLPQDILGEQQEQQLPKPTTKQPEKPIFTQLPNIKEIDTNPYNKTKNDI
eukprot:UN04636